MVQLNGYSPVDAVKIRNFFFIGGVLIVFKLVQALVHDATRQTRPEDLGREIHIDGFQVLVNIGRGDLVKDTIVILLVFYETCHVLMDHRRHPNGVFVDNRVFPFKCQVDGFPVVLVFPVFPVFPVVLNTYVLDHQRGRPHDFLRRILVFFPVIVAHTNAILFDQIQGTPDLVFGFLFASQEFVHPSIDYLHEPVQLACLFEL